MDAMRQQPLVPPMPGTAGSQGSPFGQASCTSSGSVAPLFFVGNSTPTSVMDQQQYNFHLAQSHQLQQQQVTSGCNAAPPPAQIPCHFGCNGGAEIGAMPAMNNQMVLQMGQPQQQVYFDSFMPNSMPIAGAADPSSSFFVNGDCPSFSQGPFY